MVVENRQGGDGIPAVQSMLSDRDNHSLIYGFAGLVSINPIIHEKLPYDAGARHRPGGKRGRCDDPAGRVGEL